MMNRKAQVLSETINAAWRIFILAAIVLVISSSISSVFSSKQDVRPAEAIMLSRSAVECVTDLGIANKNFDLNNCLTLDQRDYFVNATLYSLESNFSKSQVLGAESIKSNCLIAQRGLDYGASPVCTESKTYVLINEGNKTEGAVLIVYSGIRKVEANV